MTRNGLQFIRREPASQVGSILALHVSTMRETFMKSIVAGILVLAVPLVAWANGDGVRFDTVISADGRKIATPSVWVAFGDAAVIEVPGKARVVASAAAPQHQRSEVTARFYYFANGSWVLDWETSMEARIDQTPSFEKDLGDGVHRVVVMPRPAGHPASGGN